MKSLFEELGGTYTLSKDGMYYPDLTIEETDQRPIGKWVRMHKAYLEEVHAGRTIAAAGGINHASGFFRAITIYR